MQSIPPLKVSTTDKPVITDAARQMAREASFTVEQLLGIEDLPTNIDEKDLAWKYVLGNPLVRPEEVELLPTQMRRLHDWYLREVKDGRESLMVKVKPEHYYHGKMCGLNCQNFFSYTIKTHWTNLSSVAIVYK